MGSKIKRMDTYTKEDYQQALYSLQTDVKFRRESDLEFLKEIKEHLIFFQEKRDITRFELAKDMVSDWITELEKLTHPF